MAKKPFKMDAYGVAMDSVEFTDIKSGKHGSTRISRDEALSQVYREQEEVSGYLYYIGNKWFEDFFVDVDANNPLM